MKVWKADAKTPTKRGELLGFVESDFLCGCSFIPNFTIRNAKREVVYSVRRDRQCSMCPCCASCAGDNQQGYVISDRKNGGTPGGIKHLEEDKSKHLLEDSFRIQFPENSAEDDRLLMLAAGILVDYDLYDAPVPQQQAMARAGTNPVPADHPPTGDAAKGDAAKHH